MVYSIFEKISTPQHKKRNKVIECFSSGNKYMCGFFHVFQDEKLMYTLIMIS